MRNEHGKPPPFFMFGFDRSGTTLLAMMVGAHPQIAVPFSVTGMWYRYAKKLPACGEPNDDRDRRRIVEDLLGEERIRLWNVPLSAEEILDSADDGSFASIVDGFHRAYARRLGKPLWGNIDIATIDNLDIANRWFPQARFVHIVRDGRDVALSHEKYRYGLSNTLECATEWKRRVQTNLKIGAVLDPDRYFVIRYEDLVLDSKKTLGDLCTFLGVSYTDEMLDYPQTVDDRVPKEKRFLWPSLNQKPVATNAYRWRQVMSVAKRTVFEWHAGDLLAALGYETYEQTPKRLDAYLLELWQFLGRGGRFRRFAARLSLRRP